MDRLIRTAWRAFWVGLGASAVLIGQSIVPPAPAPSPSDPVAPPVVAPLQAPAAARPTSADPILSRNPFDSKVGPLSRCEVVANVRRCS